ncbi:isopentenyl-diphosphate delta-isomerase [Paracoccus spongiarum]|uniref:Isopentenyl-diphosphate Delta-isomerase n=1 Tax=Paracoccus spongiarum TaxID=3064387 RepID=A0ABT9JC15_9RHOB|nr:isopentenyl-diphosphate delta-isomerase [Paracoccus sp. 2205BS29-5]MDP5307360.1 isopentenyl-diphosphate delta-isomerase [Paracoccus sp. 2205BS29-5]
MSNDIPAWVNGVLQPVDKLLAHQQGLRHKAVSVFVMRGPQTLIQRRALGKYHTPGLWANSCCTHPLWAETPEDCAVRRLREELGLSGLRPTYLRRVEYRADVGGGLTEHEVVDLFSVEAPPGVAPRPDADEVMQTRWIGYDALRDEVARQPDRFTPWLRIYLDLFGAAPPRAEVSAEARVP